MALKKTTLKKPKGLKGMTMGKPAKLPHMSKPAKMGKMPKMPKMP